MFKAFLAHILILTTLTANFSQLLVYAGFELNQDYIVSELCINRNRPELHCNGKCYLKRKLKQAEQKEKNRGLEDQRSLFQQSVEREMFSFSPYEILVERKYQPEVSFTLPQFAADIFQPPCV
ncbi:MAG TPA: hypothetical protein VGC08_13780 [Pedobacter sp.]